MKWGNKGWGGRGGAEFETLLPSLLEAALHWSQYRGSAIDALGHMPADSPDRIPCLTMCLCITFFLILVMWSMQAVRQKKLSEMEAEGIPAKYRAELARKKMTNW